MTKLCRELRPGALIGSGRPRRTLGKLDDT